MISIAFQRGDRTFISAGEHPRDLVDRVRGITADSISVSLLVADADDLEELGQLIPVIKECLHGSPGHVVERAVVS